MKHDRPETSPPPEPRQHLRSQPEAIHGGDAGADCLDFSTGVSPLPTPFAIVEAARHADISRYPDPTAAPFRRIVARVLGASPDEVVAGAGSVELIWAIAQAFGGPGRRGLILAPAFGEYERALRASGAEVVTSLAEPPDFTWRIDDAHARLRTTPVDIVFICRPSNPCLTTVSAEAIADLATTFPRALFVVDEAYLPMYIEAPGVDRANNIILLRSLTKVFALPGLRIGYAIGHPSVMAAIRSVLPPWNVSAPAQAAGAVAAQSLSTWAPDIAGEIARLRNKTRDGLLPLIGLPLREGGPFLLYRLPHAAATARALHQRGVRIRHCASFGLPDCVRIGARIEAEQAQLLAAWRAVNQESKP